MTSGNARCGGSRELTRIEGAAVTTHDCDAFGGLRGVALRGGTEIIYAIDARGRRKGDLVIGRNAQRKVPSGFSQSSTEFLHSQSPAEFELSFTSNKQAA